MQSMDRDHKRADKLGQRALDRRLRHRKRKARVRLEREQLVDLKRLIEAEVGGRVDVGDTEAPEGTMSGSLADFLIQTAEQARQVAHPEIRAQLLAELVDEGARSHRDADVRGILRFDRERVLQMAREAVAYLPRQESTKLSEAPQ